MLKASAVVSFALGITVVSLASVAQASPVTINFMKSPSSASSGADDSIGFTYNSTQTLTATGWSSTSATPTGGVGGTSSQVWLGQYTHGLGVTNDTEGTGQNNWHTVDNYMNGVAGSQRYDFVQMQFSQAVQITSIVVAPFTIYNAAGGTVNPGGALDWDISYALQGVSAAGPITGVGTVANVSSANSASANFTDAAGNANQTGYRYDFNGLAFSSFFDVFADLSAIDPNVDGFKVVSVTFNTQSAVPLPRSAAMGVGLLASLGAFAAWRRRRRAADLA